MTIKEEVRRMYIKSILMVCAAVVVGVIGGFGIVGYLNAQQQIVRQTDPDDIDTRQRIDRELEEKIRLLDREIQTDTVLLTASQVSDTVYLTDKYDGADYMVLLTARNLRTGSADSVSARPLSDSSFVITKIYTDEGTFFWMTIQD